MAIDGSGHVWVSNEGGNTVTALNNAGTLFGNFAPSGSNFNGPIGVAIDGAGLVWVTNNLGNTVTALNNAGTLFGNFAPTGSMFDTPFDVAIDGSGHVWVTNNAGNTRNRPEQLGDPVRQLCSDRIDVQPRQLARRSTARAASG